MIYRKSAFFIAGVLLLSPVLWGQATESSIAKQLDGLRAVPDAQRPAATSKLALDIRALPPGQQKLKLADALTHLSTEGDQGKDTLQAVADMLAQSLQETPQPPAKDGKPAMPYLDLARLVRYEGVMANIKDPQLEVAGQELLANDADAAKADFTLKDLNGKKWTLSQLHGKIVLVSFWATWCPPCQKEMQDLDLISTHYQSQGLVILSLTSENPFTVSNFLRAHGQYHPPVLIDDNGKVAKEFHVDGLPRTFVFNKDGKLVAEAIDMRTQRQFFEMLAAAGLQPQS